MRSKRGPLGLLVLATAFLVFALGASSAQAEFGIARWEALTCNTDESAPGAGNWAANGNPCVETDEASRFYTQAAGHPPFGINAFLLNQTETPPLPDGNLAYTRTELPEGLGINPNATPQCTPQQVAIPTSATPPIKTKCLEEVPGAVIGVAYLTTLLPAEATIPAYVYNVETPADPESPYYGASSLAGFNAAGDPTYLVADLDPKDQHISFTSKPDLHAPPPYVIGFRLVFNGRAGKGYITAPSECRATNPTDDPLQSGLAVRLTKTPPTQSRHTASPAATDSSVQPGHRRGRRRLDRLSQPGNGQRDDPVQPRPGRPDQLAAARRQGDPAGGRGDQPVGRQQHRRLHGRAVRAVHQQPDHLPGEVEDRLDRSRHAVAAGHPRRRGLRRSAAQHRPEHRRTCSGSSCTCSPSASASTCG